MEASKHNPIKWENLTYDTINQDFMGFFATYMGKFARNKTKVKFSDVNSSALKKSVKGHKKQRHLLMSSFHPKAVQVQKHIFLETFGQLRK